MENNKIKSLNAKENKEEVSREQLESLLKQLIEENKELKIRFNQVYSDLISKRLDYLFKAVEFKESFSKKFILDCTKEIEAALTISEEVEKTESDN